MRDFWPVMGFLLTVAAALGIALGWIFNIVAIFNLAAADGGVTMMFVLRCVGVIFVPLGAIFGWL